MAGDTTSTVRLIFDASTDGVTRAAGQVTAALGTITKGLGGLGALGASVQGVAGVAAALTQLAPAAIIGVGALAGFIAAKQTFAVATQGFADAIGGDAEALAGLAPAAREAANAFTALKDGPFKELQQSVQQRFFEGFGEQITAVGQVALPVLRTGMEGVSTALNGIGLELLAVGQNSFALENVGQVFAGTTGFLTNARTAAADFLQGILALAGAGSQYLAGFGTALSDVGAQFTEWAQEAVRSGDVFDWIDSAVQGFRDLGAILGNVGAILGSVFGALAGDVSSPLAALAELTGRLREFFASAAAQGPLQALGETLRTVSSVLGDVLLAALSAVAPIVQALAPLVSALAQAFGDFATGALAVLGPALATVAEALTAGLAPVLPTLSAAFVNLATAVAPLVEALGGVLAQVLPVIVVLFSSLLTALTPLVTALVPVVELMGNTLTQALVTLTPILTEVALVIAETLVAAVEALVPLLPPLIEAFFAILDAVVPLIPPLLDLAVATLPLFIGALQFVLPAVTAVVDIIAVLVGVVVGLIIPIVETTTAVIESFSQMAGDVLATVGGWITDVSAFFSDLGTNVSNIVNTMVAEVLRWFGDMQARGEAIVTQLTGIVEDLVGDMQAGVEGFVGDMVDNVTGFFDDMRSDAVGTVERMVNEAIAEVQALPGRFADAAGRAVDGFVAGIRAGLGRAGAAARDLANAALSQLGIPFEFGSPSKVTRQMGLWIGQGVELGIDDSVNGIIASATAAGLAASGALQTSLTAPSLGDAAATVTARLAGSPLDAEQRRTDDLTAAVVAALQSQEVSVTVLLDGEPVRAAVRATVAANERDTVRRARVGSGVSF